MAKTRTQVLLAVHDRAVHEAAQVRVVARHAVLLDAQHAIEAALRVDHVLLVTKAVEGRAGAHAEQHQQAEHIGDPADIDEAQRGKQRRRDEANAELEVAGEDERRGHGDEQAAECAARRDREIESGETTRRRSGAIQLAMAEKAADEEARQENAQLQAELVVIVGIDQEPRHGHERDQDQRPKVARLIPVLALEGDDEGGEIERERHEPEERHRRHVLGEMVGDGEQ